MWTNPGTSNDDTFAEHAFLVRPHFRATAGMNTSSPCSMVRFVSLVHLQAALWPALTLALAKFNNFAAIEQYAD